MSAFLGFCHVSGGDAPSRLIAAAFCADRPQFEALVGAALAAQGYRLDRAEDVLPAGLWIARHPTAGGEALAGLVHAGRHVAFGPMTPLGGANASWEKGQNWLHVQELGPVIPLDAQFGVHPKKSVPDALQDALFGLPGPTEAERATYGADIPPLATYAVLDAAKMPYLLTSLLETSGLRHQSLFQGDAQEGLGEHAPYLVELKDGHDFTRRLFTGPEGVGGLWEKELGIFIRSRAGFDALRKHLRKFTKVQDDSGSWHFFRFWEPFHYHVLVARRSAFPALEALWSNIFAEIAALVPHVADRTVIHLSVRQKKQDGRVILTPAIRAELKRAVMYRNMIGAAHDLFELHPAEAARYGSGPPDLWPLLFDFADEVRAVCLSDPELRGRMMLLAFLKYPEPWPAFLDLPVWQRIRRSPGRANDLFEDFCARLKYLSTNRRTDLEVWW